MLAGRDFRETAQEFRETAQEFRETPQESLKFQNMTIKELSDCTGFHRESIQRRVRRFNLDPNHPDPKKIFDLKPMDDTHQKQRSLEEARTELALEDAELKRLQRKKMEERLADIDDLMPAELKLLEGISAIIKSSPLEEDRKQDIFSAIQDYVKHWEEE